MSKETELLEAQNELISEQTQLLQDLNRALQEQNERMKSLGDGYGKQSQVVQDLNGAVEDYSDTMFEMSEQQTNMNNALEEGTAKSESFSESIKSWLNKSSSAAASGLGTAIDQLGTNFSALADIITNPVQAAFGFLFTAFDILMEKAAERIQDFLDFREALERVRKEFGSFTENTSGRIYKSFTQFNGSLREAAGNTGVFASKFNMGMQGTIERLEVVAEMAGELGATFDVLGNEFNDATAQLFVMKKALLFSGEALKNVSVMSIVSGKSLKQFSNDTLASVNKIGRQLGISSKVLGQDVGKFLSNFKSLGRMTGDYVTEITKAAAYTRKLGIELDALAGLNQKFDDFEQGAEAAAQLAAGFGMVIDPIKLIQAQNPADVLTELQKAFAATGRSFETLSRQDKALLASQSGLTEEQAALAFSAKGLSMSYDEVKTAADGAMKSQKSQEEIMQDLADSIENVIIPLQAVGSFFEMFKKGFTDALIRSGPVQKTISALATALLDVYYAGMRTFSAFLKIPGVNAVFTGLLGVATKVGEIFTKLATTVEDFVGMMSTDPKMAAKNLVTGITDTFINGFNSIFTPGEGGSSLFDTIIDGLGQTFLAIAAALPGLALGLVKSLKSVLTNLIKIMRDSFKKPESGQPTVGQALFSAIKEGFNDLITELPSLIPVVIEFGTELVTFIGRAIQEFPFATLFVAGGPLLTAAAGIFNQVKDTIAGLFTGGGTTEALTGAAAKVDEGTKAQTELAAALNKQGAAMTDTGPDGFGNLVGKFGGAAAKAAEYAAIAFGIGIIGDAIIKLLKAVLEPEGKSLIDLFVLAGIKLGIVNPAGLESAMLITGSVLVAVLGGIAAMMLGIFSMDKEKLLLVAGGGFVAGGVIGLITEALGSAIPMISTMISTMLAYLSGEDFAKQLEGITKLSKSIKPEDMDAVGNLGGIFSSVGSMMGTLVKVGSDLNSLPSIPKNMGTGPDGKPIVGQESASEKISRIMGYISSVIGNKTDKTGIVGVIGKFEDALGPDVTTATQKFQAIALMIDPISKMMTAFGSSGLEFVKTVSGLAANGATVNVDEVIGQARKFISSVGGAAVDILLDINTRVNMTTEQVNALSGKLSLISTTATFLGTFGSSMKQLLAAVQAFDTSGDTASAMKSLQSFLFGNSGGIIETDMESIPVESMDGVIPVMMRVMGDIATFLNSGSADVVDTSKLDFFTNLFSTSGSLTGMINAISSASKIGRTGAADAINFLYMMSGEGGKGGSFAGNLYAVVSQFEKFDQIDLAKLDQRETNMKGAFNVIGSYIEGITGTLTTGASGRVKGSLTQLNELRAMIADTSATLEALDLVKLDASVEKFGANMNVVKKKFEVNGGKVQINVTMNVTMNAQKMAETLVMDGFVQPNTEFGEYLQSPDTVKANQYDYENMDYRGANQSALPLATPRKQYLGQ